MKTVRKILKTIEESCCSEVIQFLKEGKKTEVYNQTTICPYTGKILAAENGDISKPWVVSFNSGYWVNTYKTKKEAMEVSQVLNETDFQGFELYTKQGYEDSMIQYFKDYNLTGGYYVRI